jgi:hypothetical protein
MKRTASPPGDADAFSACNALRRRGAAAGKVYRIGVPFPAERDSPTEPKLAVFRRV